MIRTRVLSTLGSGADALVGIGSLKTIVPEDEEPPGRRHHSPERVVLTPRFSYSEGGLFFLAIYCSLAAA